MSDPIHTATIPLELTNGNDGQGRAWYRTAGARKAIADELRLRGMTRQPFDRPVRLRVVRVLGKGQHVWDYDSVLRGNAKQLIDSLVAVGWFHDDGPKWITEVIGDQDDSRRGDGPSVVVEVFEV